MTCSARWSNPCRPRYSGAMLRQISGRPFLGVERSLTGRAWRHRLDEAAQAQALAMVQAHGIEDVLARVLAGRGVLSADVPTFLEPKLRSLLPDPFTLVDMERAVVSARGRRDPAREGGHFRRLRRGRRCFIGAHG